ncbi:hypothetical protein CRENBAI_002513 [Crenichthys baileyi]|uniref:DDE Tnp4 domain-containing protein n=1 Tax=Crenichthys baileyi TaxID=28760 RepID=A0AAV9QYY3_9TELE
MRSPGFFHNACILKESTLYKRLLANQPVGIVLEDAAYPLPPRPMAPFLAPNSPEQAHFYTAHSKTRCTIKLLHGALKRCFVCLKYMQVEPQEVSNLILAVGAGVFVFVLFVFSFIVGADVLRLW